MKVYIEDPMTNELMISGVPCRKLGQLKNGETAEFMIENEAAKVFVIADTLSKELCSESYQLPYGEEDVSLSGKNHYNPGAGNPFYFDGVTDPTILAGRKKKSKIGIWVLIGAFIVGIGIGLLGSLPDLLTLKDKNVEVEEFNMTLTGDFKKIPNSEYDFVYGNMTYSVFGFNETFDGASAYSVSDYGNAFIEYNEFDSTHKLKTKDGLTYMEYEARGDDGESYHYWVFFYKNVDEFWVVHIASVDKTPSEVEDYVMGIAKTVTFDAE
jgi:hypothetical protein